MQLGFTARLQRFQAVIGSRQINEQRIITKELVRVKAILLWHAVLTPHSMLNLPNPRYVPRNHPHIILRLRHKSGSGDVKPEVQEMSRKHLTLCNKR
jgi:hypothetical protein